MTKQALYSLLLAGLLLASPFLLQMQTSSNLAGAAVNSKEDDPRRYMNARGWNNQPFKIIPPSETTLPIWGSYRPGYYFGMKTATAPLSTATGIMWTTLSQSKRRRRPRHATAQGESKFDWLVHDGEGFGVEKMVDSSYGLEISASFMLSLQGQPLHGLSASGHAALKSPTWLQSIKMKPIASKPPKGQVDKALMFYFGVEGDLLSMSRKESDIGISKIEHSERATALQKEISFVGFSEQLGWFTVETRVQRVAHSGKGKAKNVDAGELSISFVGLQNGDVNAAANILHHDDNYSGDEYTQRNSRHAPKPLYNKHGRLSDVFEQQSHFVALEVQDKFATEVVLDVALFDHLVVESAEEAAAFVKSHSLLDAYSRETIDTLREARSKAFHEKFEETFQLRSKVKGNSGASGREFSEADVAVAETLLSSLLGGIGHFYGQPVVGHGMDVNEAGEEVDLGVNELGE